MKFTKFVVIACGAIGLVAFFLPLLHVKEVGAKVSAFDVIKGLDKLKAGADEVKGKADEELDKAGKEGKEVKAKLAQAHKDAKDAADVATWIFLVPFAPAAFFVLFGLLGLKRFGRGLGFGTLFFGLVGIAIWALINQAAAEVGVQDATGSALPALAVSYFGAALFGLVALIKPEPKVAAMDEDAI